MMDYRYPYPIIDPTDDLATVPYHHLHHNDCILPLDSERIGISEILRTTDR